MFHEKYTHIMSETKQHLSVVVSGHIDAGKCFQQGTLIKTPNGKDVKVEDLNVGDTVMGDDSTPRTIQSITSGIGEMYNVIQKSYGNTYCVNGNHILTLKVTGCKNFIYDNSRDRYRIRWMTKEGLKETSFSRSKFGENYINKAQEFLNEIQQSDEYLKKGDVIDINIQDFMKLNKSSQQMLKGFAVGVEYNSKEVTLDPYLLGVWLGDGFSSASNISNGDEEVINYIKKWADDNEMIVTNTKEYSYAITSGTAFGGPGRNKLTNELRKYNVWQNKHIPDDYKYNSRLTRLTILAGLLDTDGYLHNNCYEITQKNKKLAYDIVELSKSLGFRTTYNTCMKSCTNSPKENHSDEYVRIFISGDGLDDIPCIVNRKKAQKRQTVKDALSSGILIDPVGMDKYYGFELDGNGRFLLSDFTVTHNSTTTGHLLFKLGGISDREMEKLQAEADAQGKSSFAFAYYMDKGKEERARGVTIDCATKEFFTDSYHYTIVDAPGHRDYIKNMISGAGCADVALLLVPAEQGGFEKAISKGNHKTGEVQGQTRQHARLLNLLGVNQLIVGVNKMDSCGWSEERFREIESEMQKMITDAGYKASRVPIIPYSGFHGENLISQTDKMPWYKGWKVPVSKTETVEGHTLYDALEKMVRVPKRNESGPVRVPINGVYKIKGVGDIITGRVEQGILRVGDQVAVCPRNIKGAKVFSLEMHHKSWEEAKPGDNVGISLKGLDKKNMPKVGDVIYLEKEPELKPVKRFTAVVAVQEHPGELKPGFAPVIHVRTSKSACSMKEIHWRSSKKTNNEQVENPPFIVRGDQAEVVFEPMQPIYMEPYKQCPGLGRIAVMDSNNLVMLGKVIDCEYA
jgi:elongation factor 1-alpha